MWFYWEKGHISNMKKRKMEHLPHISIYVCFLSRAVGLGGAEGLQPHQYFRIKVVKELYNPINIQ